MVDVIQIPERAMLGQFLGSELDYGYNPVANTWEVIVKYHGDIMKLEKELGAEVENLGEGFAIITLQVSQIQKLYSYPEIESIEKPKRLAGNIFEGTRSSCISAVHVSPYNLSGKGTLIAILDSGINYTHPDFRNEDGTTRIRYIWDQTATGTPPSGFKNGVEYNSVRINEALISEDPFSVVPEMDQVGHGTGVAGVAAGNGRVGDGNEIGVAPQAELLVVKLGERGFPSFARTTELMRGLKYAIDKAQTLNMPVAINISFGTNDGAHDGNSIFEAYINDMADRWKTTIVVSSGNEGVAGHHYSGQIASNETQDVTFAVSGDIPSFFLSMWKNFVDELDVELITPNGNSTGIVRFIDLAKVIQFSTTSIFINYSQPRYYNEDQNIYFQISSTNRQASQGIWTLRIHARHVMDGQFDIWLPVSEVVSRNTAFSNPSRNTTLTIPSTAQNVITVGGYDHETNAIASFSGTGYTRGNVFEKPDLVAPAVNILSTSSNGRYDTFTGTSIAAPFVTGSAALIMEWGIVRGNAPDLYGQMIKAYLKSGAERQGNVIYPNNTWGYGRLCLQNTMDQLRFNIGEGQVTTKSYRRELDQLLSQPDTVDFHAWHTPELTEYIQDKPHIKIGSTLANGSAVLYTSGDNVHQIFADMDYDFIEAYPEIYGLLGQETEGGLFSSAHIRKQIGRELTGRGVMIGLIDTGIDYTKDCFRRQDGSSRIHAIWDQTQSGIPSEDVQFGAVYTRGQIDEALKNQNPYNIVPQKDQVGHGTFLGSVAAGEDDEAGIGIAPDAGIISVKLRKANPYYLKKLTVPEEQDNAFASTDIMLAINYIVTEAARLKKPVVIALGLGSNFGGQGGMSKLEQYITYLSREPGVIFAAAAGNEGNTCHHTGGKIKTAGDEETIDVSIENTVSDFSMYIWHTEQDKFTATVAACADDTKVSILYSKHPTGFIHIRVQGAEPGIFRIKLRGDVLSNGVYQAWLPLTGLVSPNVSFASPTPDYTVVAPAASPGSITATAYNSQDDNLYRGASWGPTTTARISPDFAVPGVDVAGIYPAGRGVMTGTSVAAAITAGVSALMLEWGIVRGNDPQMDTNRLRKMLVSSCSRDGDVTYPNVRWGYGKININQPFSSIEEGYEK